MQSVTVAYPACGGLGRVTRSREQHQPIHRRPLLHRLIVRMASVDEPELPVFAGVIRVCRDPAATGLASRGSPATVRRSVGCSGSPGCPRGGTSRNIVEGFKGASVPGPRLSAGGGSQPRQGALDPPPASQHRVPAPVAALRQVAE